MADGQAQVQVGVVVRKWCGFLDESPGVRSSTRLIAIACMACAVILALATVVYIFYSLAHHMQPSPDLINALTLMVTAFVANGAVAIVRRGNGD
jgi:hypothetical protein